MREFLSVCPYDCPDACGLIFEVENDKVIKVKGNPDHPYTRGTLCPKMVHYEDTIYNEGRILTPLKRVGKKGEGTFEPISWSQAIAEIATKFKENIQKYGGESILSYSYAGTMGLVQGHVGDALFKKIGATRQDQGICCPAKNYGWRTVMGESYSSPSQEMAKSDMVVLWSSNTLASNIHVMHDVLAARRNGAKIWAIDTYYSTTLQQADDYILVRPGSDGAFALGVMHILERDNLVNQEFISKSVQGYEEFKTQILPTYTPEKVEDITGVAVEKLEAFAHAYGHAKGPFIRLGSGLARYGNGAMTVRTVTCLPAVVGAYTKVGGGMLCTTGDRKPINSNCIVHDDWLEKLSKLPRIMPMIKLGEALTTWQNPPINCLYIHSSNPAITAPNQNIVRQGLLRDDLFVVVHERFLTDTTKYADIVLPATSSAEHDDIYYAYGHYNVGTGYQVISPVGESKSNWEVYQLLAEAMGITDEFFKLSAKDLIKIIVNHSVNLTESQQEDLLAGKLVEQQLPENYKLKFFTPSGKIEILNPSEEFSLPQYIESHAEKDTADFWLINPPDLRILDSSFNERTFSEKEDKMVVYINPLDAAKLKIAADSKVVLYNERGEVQSVARFNDKVKEGTLVMPGVWWQKYSSDPWVGINVLTSDRPTDKAYGSTFYDVKTNIRPLYK